MAQTAEESTVSERDEHSSLQSPTYNRMEHYDSYTTYRQLREGGMSRAAAEAVLSSQLGLMEMHLPSKEDFGKLEGRFESLERRVENLEHSFEHLQISVSALPQQVEEMIKNSQQQMETKFEHSQQQMETKFEHSQQQMESKFENSQQKMETRIAAGNLSTLKWTFSMIFTMTAVLVAVLKLFPG